MRLFALLMLMLTTCQCAAVQRPATRDDGLALTAEQMMQTTVQVEVKISGLGPRDDEADGGQTIAVPVEHEWKGSGVVYEKTNGILTPVRSLILTANHVLDLPEVGKLTMRWDEPMLVNRVEVTILTHEGVICNLKPLATGADDTRDVATGEADCDAGRVAALADRIPPDGGRVYISGHPLGIPTTVLTEGFSSGWSNGFLLVSAPSAPGNSGGPVFYRGKVVGLLVRGQARAGYANIGLATPLAEILKRVSETPHL